MGVNSYGQPDRKNTVFFLTTALKVVRQNIGFFLILIISKFINTVNAVNIIEAGGEKNNL